MGRRRQTDSRHGHGFARREGAAAWRVGVVGLAAVVATASSPAAAGDYDDFIRSFSSTLWLPLDESYGSGGGPVTNSGTIQIDPSDGYEGFGDDADSDIGAPGPGAADGMPGLDPGNLSARFGPFTDVVRIASDHRPWNSLSTTLSLATALVRPDAAGGTVLQHLDEGDEVVLQLRLDESGHLTVDFSPDGSDERRNTLVTHRPLEPNRWTQVVVSFEADELRVLLDAQTAAVRDGVIPSFSSVSTTRFYAGVDGRGGTESDPFDGGLDEIAVSPPLTVTAIPDISNQLFGETERAFPRLTGFAAGQTKLRNDADGNVVVDDAGGQGNGVIALDVAGQNAAARGVGVGFHPFTMTHGGAFGIESLVDVGGQTKQYGSAALSHPGAGNVDVVADFGGIGANDVLVELREGGVQVAPPFTTTAGVVGWLPLSVTLLSSLEVRIQDQRYELELAELTPFSATVSGPPLPVDVDAIRLSPHPPPSPVQDLLDVAVLGSSQSFAVRHADFLDRAIADLNLDGTTDARDFELLGAAVASGIEPPLASAFPFDLDGSGRIDVLDWRAFPFTQTLSTGPSVDLDFVALSPTINIGQSVLVDVVVSGLGAGSPPSIGGFEIAATYDPAVLHFDDASFGSGLGTADSDPGVRITAGADAGYTVLRAPGRVLLFGASLLDESALHPIQGFSTTLATLHFTGRALGEGALGAAVVELADAGAPTAAFSVTLSSDFVGVGTPAVPVLPRAIALVLAAALAGASAFGLRRRGGDALP